MPRPESAAPGNRPAPRTLHPSHADTRRRPGRVDAPTLASLGLLLATALLAVACGDSQAPMDVPVVPADGADIAVTPGMDGGVDGAESGTPGCSPLVECSGRCVDSQTDIHNCGGCGRECSTLPGVIGSAVRCVAGACDLTAACPAGRAHCGADPSTGCETDLTTPGHCGSCATACAEPTPMCTMGAGDGGGYGCASGCTGATGTRCGGMCVNTQTDALNCGGCGRACTPPANANARCNAGSCGFECVVGYHLCGGTCLRDDSINSCGTSCTRCPVPTNGLATCNGTTCGFTCSTGFHACDGACAADGSVMTCGTSCTPCPARANATPTCSGTACGFTCNPGFADCDRDASNGCEADLTSSATCGACTTSCSGATPFCGPASGGGVACTNNCRAPTSTLCGGNCVDTTSNPTFCGSCTNACSAPANAVATCASSTCGFACAMGFHLCGGACVANTSVMACGASCTPCPAVANGAATCDGTACGIACDAGYHLCGGACVSDSSVMTCGGGCTPCAGAANGTATCDGTMCGLACNPGYHACGTSCALNSSLATCGALCVPCPVPPNATAATCDGTSCGFSCQSGFGDCDASPVNGCESRLNTAANCGSCGGHPTEVCNGLDDNCSGATDEGCPSAITFSGTTALPQRGGTGGTAFDNACPAGQVLIGLLGRSGDWIDQIQGVCGTVTVVEGRTTNPYTYSATVAMGTTLAAHGSAGGGTFSMMCPANTVVTSVSGSADAASYIDRLRITCSRFAITGLPTAVATVTVSTSFTAGIGGRSGVAFDDGCSGSQVVNRVFGRSATYLDAFGVSCTTPALTTR